MFQTAARPHWREAETLPVVVTVVEAAATVGLAVQIVRHADIGGAAP